MRLFFYTIITALAISNASYAEDIKITADDRVEFHQNENKMIAIGNAFASKKDLSISAHRMTAYYEKGGEKSGIKTVNASGNVIMKSPKANGYGDTMDYNVKEDYAILKGNPAKIKTDKETITATDSITYYPSQQKAIAEGNVVVSDEQNKIYSNKLVSYFKKSQSGALELDKVEIFDNVKIITPKATVTSKKGTYFPQTGIVELYDDVTIQQGENILKGDKAESNLNTGISKLLSSGSKGRVSGVFKEKDVSDASKKDGTQEKEEQTNEEL